MNQTQGTTDLLNKYASHYFGQTTEDLCAGIRSREDLRAIERYVEAVQRLVVADPDGVDSQISTFFEAALPVASVYAYGTEQYHLWSSSMLFERYRSALERVPVLQSRLLRGELLPADDAYISSGLYRSDQEEIVELSADLEVIQPLLQARGTLPEA